MSLTDYEINLLKNVDKHGWHATTVFDPKGHNPSFTYSTGFAKSLNKPEFIVFGLSNDLMHDMLWEIYEQLKAGAIPEDGMRWKNVLEGFDCISKKAKHPDLFDRYATTASWLWNYEKQIGEPEVFQLVWPGAQQGLFPWEEDCDSYVVEQQFPLWID